MTSQPQPHFFTFRNGIQHTMTSLHRSIIMGLCVLFMSGLMAGSLLPAAAQSVRSAESSTTPPSATWTRTIGHQLAKALTSPIDDQRSQAFQLVTHYAQQQTGVDLKPTIPVLVAIYKKDSDARYRLAAVSALHAIGDETAMQQVRRSALRQPSKLVQYVSMSVLLDYYGSRTFDGDAAAAALAQNLRDHLL